MYTTTSQIAPVKEQRECVECHEDFTVSFKTQQRCKKCVFNSPNGRQKVKFDDNKYLDIAHPELVEYFNVDKNASIGIKLRDYTITSHIKMWFKCPKCSFEFFISMAAFVKKSHKCKQCRHKAKAEKTCVDCGNLFYSYDYKVVRCSGCIKKKVDLSYLCNRSPLLFKKLDPKLNPDKNLCDLKINNTETVNWLCNKCNQVQNSSTSSLKQYGFFCHNCKHNSKLNREQKERHFKNKHQQQKAAHRLKRNKLKIKQQQKINDLHVKTVQNTLKKIFEKRPHILKELHPTKNDSFFQNKNSQLPTKKSCRELIWVCSNCNHEWKANIRSRASEKKANYTSGKDCPYCNSFASKNPEKLKDWDYNKNVGMDPYFVPPVSGKKYHWVCHNCKCEWYSNIQNNCPECVPQRSSIIERKLYYLFTLVFDKNHVKNSFKFHGRKEFDILLETYKIGIEYDGVYFHKDSTNKDKLKNSLAKKYGFKLYRVRELGLNKISSHDYIYDFSQNLKKPFLYLLDTISKEYKLSESELENIKTVKNLDYDNLNIPKSFLIYPLVENSIFETHKEICNFFNTEKNVFTPQMLTKGMSHRVFWNCNKCGKIFQRSVHANIKTGATCKTCLKKPAAKKFDVKTDIPADLYKELYKPENQNIKNINKLCEWSCNFFPQFPHTYYASIKNRLKGANCNLCKTK